MAKNCGGTIINIIVGVIFFGLIGLSLWWVFKTAGQAGHEYSQAMINTSSKASVIKCQTNLRTIWQNIQIYATTNGDLPASQQELINFSGTTQLFHCDEPNAPDYIYIPGQSDDMPTTNVLLYEPLPVHNRQSSVLYLSGQIELLSPEELREAVEATILSIRQRGR